MSIVVCRPARAARALALAFTVVVAAGGWAPGRAQDFACPANAPPTDSTVDQLLTNLTLTLNGTASQPGEWAAKATNIDPLTFSTSPTSQCPSDGGSTCFFSTGLTDCEHATSDWTITGLTGLSDLTFSSITTASFDVKDVATHSAAGPDAGKISDGVFAPEGTSWNDPSYTVILPLAGQGYALSIDLGASTVVCGSGSCRPKIQADKNEYQFDYSLDGNNWTPYAQLPTASSDGLRTRQINTSSSSVSTFTARYVRIWGLSGDGNYSVSEMQVSDTSNKLLSVAQLAIGPRPYQIADGVVAKAGTTWNDKTYAAVLRTDGAGNALAIDLGATYSLCGGGACGQCATTNPNTCGPVVQADKNEYQFDYSLDGTNWVSYGQLPTVSSDGLQTRKVTRSSSSTDAFNARYVRIWGLSGDGNYSVSEVMLTDANGNAVPIAQMKTFGPEPYATDGEIAPEGADWNDPRWANILTPCTIGACPAGTTKPLTARLPIDLTASFPIEALSIQADRHQFQVDYLDEQGNWQSLATLPSTGDSGLSTRPVTFTTPLPVTTRQLAIYGTAGDDENYSVSAVHVTTSVAKTACASNSGADYDQNLSCSYDGQLDTVFGYPSGGLPVTFTVTEAKGYLRCTNGTSTGSTPSETLIPSGTSCSGKLVQTNTNTGTFCSGTCASSSSTSPTSVLTYVGFASTTLPILQLVDVDCPGVNLDTDALTGLVAVVAGGSSNAVTTLFNGLGSAPSGVCAVPATDSNAVLSGSATQVGRDSHSGQVRLTGTFTMSAAGRLDELEIELRSLIAEPDGGAELVRKDTGESIAPLRLLPRVGSGKDRVVYATAPGVAPAVRIEVRRSKHGSAEFDIDVHRATLSTGPACDGASSTAELETAFVLESQDGTSIDVRAREDWSCEGEHRLTTR